MITLIGKDLAKEGLSFIFKGPAEECEECRFKSSCITPLEENRKYIITDVLENEQKCMIHNENKVIPVKVERDSIDLLTQSKNIFEGSTFTYKLGDCDEESCEFYHICFPEGLIDNDKCIITKNKGKHTGECIKGYKLNKIELSFVI